MTTQIGVNRCTEEQLFHFKDICKDDIASKRSYERVKCIQDLINILIKRDCAAKIDYILNALHIRRDETANENVRREAINSNVRRPNVIQTLRLEHNQIARPQGMYKRVTTIKFIHFSL